MPLRSIARLGVVEFVEEGRDVSSFMKGMAHWRPFEASPVRRLYNIITSKRVASGREAVQDRNKD